MVCFQDLRKSLLVVLKKKLKLTKKGKIVVSCVVVLVVLSVLFVLISYLGGFSGNGTSLDVVSGTSTGFSVDNFHQHTYSLNWSSNANGHWHNAICDHTSEQTDFAVHTPVVDVAISASCLHTGLTEGSHCSVCGYVISAQQIIPKISPTGDHILNDSGVCTLCGVDCSTVIGFTGLLSMQIYTNSLTDAQLTWTDDAANKPDYQIVNESGSIYSFNNPLRSMWPYRYIDEVTDGYGNVFMRFPKIYIKYVLNNDGLVNGVRFSNCLSPNGETGFFLPDAYLNFTTNTSNGGAVYGDYFYIGRYQGSLNFNNTLVSKAGTTACNVDATDNYVVNYGNYNNCYNGYCNIDYPIYQMYNYLVMMYFHSYDLSFLNLDCNSNDTGTLESYNNYLNVFDRSTGDCRILGVENFYRTYTIISGLEIKAVYNLSTQTFYPFLYLGCAFTTHKPNDVEEFVLHSEFFEGLDTSNDGDYYSSSLLIRGLGILSETSSNVFFYFEPKPRDGVSYYSCINCFVWEISEFNILNQANLDSTLDSTISPYTIIFKSVPTLHSIYSLFMCLNSDVYNQEHFFSGGLRLCLHGIS